MSYPSAPLARRTAGGVVVDEQLVRVACRWTDLTSRDGERFDVDWAGQVGCVDTPADRQLLAERLLSPESPTLPVSAIVRLLVEEGRPSLARFIAKHDAAALLDGAHDDAIGKAIEADARRAGFAAGLRVAGPFTLSIDSPSIRRVRDAARARAQLDALGVADASRATDPLDVLRAVATTNSRWSMVGPALWIIAGDQLVAVDPTRPDLSQKPLKVVGIGPLRSVSGEVQHEGMRLFVGGRGGVAIVDSATGHAVTFTYESDVDTGFNAVAFDESSRSLLGTHSSLGLIRWRVDEQQRPGGRIDLGSPNRGARATLAGREGAFALDDVGRLHRVRDGRATFVATGDAPIVSIAIFDDGRLLIADAERNVSVFDPAAGDAIARSRASSPISNVAAIELCGLPRAIVSHEDGSITLFDPEAGTTTPLAGTRWPARAIRARPGFVALLSVDRQRVALIDLARPNAIAAELHVAATLDRRAADLAFA